MYFVDGTLQQLNENDSTVTMAHETLVTLMCKGKTFLIFDALDTSIFAIW